MPLNGTLASGSVAEAEAIATRMVQATPNHFGPHDLLGRIAVRQALGLQAAGRDAESTSMFVVAYGHYEDAARLARRLPVCSRRRVRLRCWRQNPRLQ